MAFLPYKERPLEKWILAFFRSIYSPTYYAWDSGITQNVIYQPETQESQVNLGRQSTAKESLTLPFLANLDQAESNFLTKLGGVFNSQPNPAPQAPTTYSPPQTQTIEVKIPQNIPVASPQPLVPARPVHVVQEIGAPSQPIPTSIPVFSASPQASPGATQQAQFSPDATTPMTPEKPNTVSGQVMDVQGKIVEGAIIEIQDDQTRPVRALKSNKAGHFLSVTPLLSGKYTLTIEKDGLEFDPLTFEARGEIIPAMAIRAKNSLVN